MVSYVCDFCGKVLSTATRGFNYIQNPYSATINIKIKVSFGIKEKQYHACKECVDNIIRGTEILDYITDTIKEEGNI